MQHLISEHPDLTPITMSRPVFEMICSTIIRSLFWQFEVWSMGYYLLTLVLGNRQVGQIND